MDLASLATVVGPMLFCLSLTFARYLDARAIDQKVQSRCRRLRSDRYRKLFTTPTYGTEVGHLPIKPGELEQLCAVPTAWRTARLNKFLIVRQNWIAATLYLGRRPRLPLALPRQHMSVSSQMSREPSAFSAAL